MFRNPDDRFPGEKAILHKSFTEAVMTTQVGAARDVRLVITFTAIISAGHASYVSTDPVTLYLVHVT